MKAPLSLRPHERLKKRSQFQKVYREGRLVRSRSLKLMLLGSGLAYNRIGFSVEKRKIPLSTGRVRVKRLLREAYRQSKPCLRQGFDMVIIAGTGTRELDFKKAQEEILHLYRLAGLEKA